MSAPGLSTPSSPLPASDASAGPVALSIVIPFYNESANIAPLLTEVRATATALALNIEVICVDDGSRDTTAAELAAAALTWPAVRVISFPQNHGQAAALWHGFLAARGEFVAMLDGDGQNPPAELARLWPLRETADMISGARAGRQDSALRRTMSRLANTVRRTLLRDGVTDTGCSLKIFRREVVASFLPIRTLYSFIPAFAVSAGFTVREVPVAHRPRLAGVSNYGLRVMALHPLLDLLALTWLLRRTLRRKA